MSWKVDICFKQLTVAIVENQPASLRGLLQTLEELGCTVAWTAREASEVREKAVSLFPDVTFVDLRLDRAPSDYSTGYQIIQDLQGLDRNAAIIVYSATPVVDEIMLEAVHSGCSYIIKEDAWNCERDIVAAALLAALTNSVMLSKEAANSIENITSKMQGTHYLTERQLEVLALVADGYSDKEVAEELVISLTTVKTHIQSIFRKLEVTNRTKASQWYRNNYG